MHWGNKLAISVASGKGGVGKSSFVGNLGVAFAQQERRVILVDADIGAANLHTMVGIPYPERTLADFLNSSQYTLEQVLCPTAFGSMQLLSSAADILAIASPTYQKTQKLYRSITRLESDLVIFDIAAGTNQRAIDFFSLAPVGIIIVEAVPTSLENAFLFIKNLRFRTLLRLFYHDKQMRATIEQFADPRYGNKILNFESLLTELDKLAPQKVAMFRGLFTKENYRLCLVANSIKNEQQAMAIEKFAKVVKRYLDLSPLILGVLPYEPEMDIAISQRTPFIVKYPQSGYAKAMHSIVASIPAF